MITRRQMAEWTDVGRAKEDARRVRRGANVSGLPVATCQLEFAVKIGASELDLEKWMEAYRISAIIVVVAGEIMLERYSPGRHRTDHWYSQSVAKSVTSLLAGIAIKDGALGLEDLVVDKVPELKGSAYERATVRHLLTMSTGVTWHEDHNAKRSEIAAYYNAINQAGTGLAYLAKLKPDGEHGIRFNYNTADTDLLGLIISRAVGSRLSDFLSARIWQPCGMERDAYWLVDGNGHELAGSSLYMTLGDYARVGQFALEKGKIANAQILPDDWMAESGRVQFENGRGPGCGYGYQWWVGPGCYEASGIHGQSILVSPKERVIIAINSDAAKADCEEHLAALAAFQSAAIEAAGRV